MIYGRYSDKRIEGSTLVELARACEIQTTQNDEYHSKS